MSTKVPLRCAKQSRSLFAVAVARRVGDRVRSAGERGEEESTERPAKKEPADGWMGRALTSRAGAAIRSGADTGLHWRLRLNKTKETTVDMGRIRPIISGEPRPEHSNRPPPRSWLCSSPVSASSQSRLLAEALSCSLSSRRRPSSVTTMRTAPTALTKCCPRSLLTCAGRTKLRQPKEAARGRNIQIPRRKGHS